MLIKTTPTNALPSNSTLIFEKKILTYVFINTIKISSHFNDVTELQITKISKLTYTRTVNLTQSIQYNQATNIQLKTPELQNIRG